MKGWPNFERIDPRFERIEQPFQRTDIIKIIYQRTKGWRKRKMALPLSEKHVLLQKPPAQ
jgi:hypothetical protein